MAGLNKNLRAIAERLGKLYGDAEGLWGTGDGGLDTPLPVSRIAYVVCEVVEAVEPDLRAEFYRHLGVAKDEARKATQARFNRSA